MNGGVDVAGIVESGGGLTIPVFVPQGPTSLQLLERIALAVEKTGTSTKAAGEKSEAAAKSWSDSLKELGEKYQYIVGAVTDFAGRVTAAAEHVAESASQAERLSRAQEGLGLSFEAAASQAGGYASQVDVATTASTLAERGIRLTQTELNALTRVAQNYARTTGKELSEVMENLSETVTEGGESLGKFDTSLLRVADTARFTAQDRLNALVQRAREISPAAQTASERMATMRGAIESADRTFSQAFVNGLARLSEVGAAEGNARDRAEELNRQLRAAGETAAEVAMRAANGFGVLIGALGTGVSTILAGLGAIGSGLTTLFSANWRNAGAAIGAAMHESLTNGITADLARFTAERVDALNRLSEEGDQRQRVGTGSRDSARRPAGADMTFTVDEARDADARAARSGSTTSGGGSSDRRTREERLMDMAIEGASSDRTRRSRGVSLADELRDVIGARNGDLEIPGEAEATARLRQITEGATAIDERRRAASTRRTGGTFGDDVDAMAQGRAQERNRRLLEDQIDAQRSLTDRWEEQHMRRVSITREAAGMIDTLYGALGQSLATHFEAIVAGREGIAAAAQGVASDVLTAGAKEAYGKAGFYAAEALGRAVMLDWPGAATSAAAAVAYGAAGAGMTALGAAVAPPPTPSTSVPAASGAPSRRGEQLGPSVGNAAAAGGATVVNHYYAPVIGGRSATDAEVGARMGRYSDATTRRQTRGRS